MIRNLLNQVLVGLLSLKGSPKELWLALFIKFLESLSYFSFSLILTIFLSKDFGYSDVEAGTIYGGWGALITLYGLASGFLVDNLGVAKSLKIGLFLSFLSRIFTYWTTSRFVLLFSLMVLLPIGECLILPVLLVGIRRYTTPHNSSMAFGLFYVIMNVAALFSGPLVDLCTYQYDDVYDNTSSYDIWLRSPYRMIVLAGLVSNSIALVASLFVREIKVSNETSSNVTEFQPRKGSIKQILMDVYKSSIFWRFMSVCLITVCIRMIFRHLDATLPKYMMREFGENVPKGTIYSINPAIIIVVVPIFTAAFKNVDPLVMIHYGCYVSAFSVFILAFSTSIWACILFVIILSIGEAMWSPRFYDYCMTVVHEGREGIYIALSSAPIFFVKLPVGFMSGYLLQKYCPEEGERNSQMMWLIIGLTTLPSPILLTVFWKYLSGATVKNDSCITPTESEPMRNSNLKHSFIDEDQIEFS